MKEKDWTTKVMPRPCPHCETNENVLYMFEGRTLIRIECLDCGLRTEAFSFMKSPNAKKLVNDAWEKMRKEIEVEKCEE